MFEQEQIDYEESRTNRRAEIEFSLISIPTKVLAAYSGEQVFFNIQVNGPLNHMVELLLKGPSGNIAITHVNPRKSRAPFTTLATINFNPAAPTGLYTLTIKLYDTESNLQLANEKVSLFILRKDTSKILANHYNHLATIFNNYGSNGLIWYILKHIYPKGAAFKQIKSIYEQIVGRDISKGTIGNILRRMIKKGIIHRENGLYKLLVTKPEILVTRIDTSRIHPYQKPKQDKQRNRHKNIKQVPQQIFWCFDRALRIKGVHGELPAMYFLAYTLVGIRWTGFLLLWFHEMFIYCEPKTGFCHYFFSSLLAEYFNRLGIRQGVLYALSKKHEEARRIAQRYIREYYRSFKVARRLHYLLKERGFIDYGDQEVYALEILHYQNGRIGVRVWDNRKEEVLVKDEITEEEHIRIDYYSAFPEEHIYQPNEETYIHRPF